jgi:hypothetical protein
MGPVKSDWGRPINAVHGIQMSEKSPAPGLGWWGTRMPFRGAGCVLYVNLPARGSAESSRLIVPKLPEMALSEWPTIRELGTLNFVQALAFSNPVGRFIRKRLLSAITSR